MLKTIIVVLAAISCHFVTAKSINESDRMYSLEEKYSAIQKEQTIVNNNLQKLTNKQKENESVIISLRKENKDLRSSIDSLQSICKQLNEVQSKDRENLNGKIDATDNNVQFNQNMIQNRTLWGITIVMLFIVGILITAYQITKRIKSGYSTIDDVRKAQDILKTTQAKMQEESIKLDNQLLAIVQKQLETSASSGNKATGEPDHTLVVKLADEIARIETNLSKMDKSVKGYKQLVQAKDRMINNVRANGYEIISLLGQEYNDGMQFQTRFVPDENLPEGKRIITGMIKMQVNYNGKMIQPAEIVVSQNI